MVSQPRAEFDITSHAPTRRSFLGIGALAADVVMSRASVAQSMAAASDSESVPGMIVEAFDALFGGMQSHGRAVHANGLLCEGVFIPTPAATSVSHAAHFRGGPISTLARFSNFAAVPGMPDGHPAASPRGLALKFFLPAGEDTDIVAHSYDGAPAGTPQEFLSFVRAAAADPATLAAFIADRPAARAFVEHPKPAPASYATEAFFGVNAFRFTNAAGASHHGRYRILPAAGVKHLSAGEAAGRGAHFLTEEFAARLGRGPASFRILVQIAEEGDTIMDGSVSWPASRRTLELGVLHLHALVAPNDPRAAELTFVPTNLVAGIAPTADPMLLARTRAYRISSERRIDAR